MVVSADGQIEGFTEPFRTIDLSSDETGSIVKLHVHEGKFVKEGEAIAQLDSRLQELQAKIAQQMSESNSELVAAEETFRKRLAISQRIRTLRDNGHATEGEQMRAEMELAIAKAKHLSAQEEAIVRNLEFERARVQLERRTVTAPFSGIVATIHRREGEFISPLHPEILTLVQVDRLLATFNIPSSQIEMFELDKQLDINLFDGRRVVGTVFSVGVQTDAQSGTVQVKLEIANPTGEIRSGEICSLNI
jgi:RND family efflux transporter MFP subunit